MPERLKLAAEAYQNGDIAEAESVCRAVLGDDPNNAPALHFLGVIAHQTQHNEAAEKLLARAATLDPLNSDCQLNLGNVLLALGRADEAMERYRSAIELNPRSGSAHSNLAAVFLARGRADEAIGACRKALEIDPTRADAHYNLAVAHMQMDQVDEGLAQLGKALELRPHYYEALQLLGTIRQRRGNAGEAVTAFREAAAAAPGSAAAHSNLGTALHDMGALNEAVACLRAALKLAPEHPDISANLANTLVDLGQVEEAQGLCREVIRAHPDHVGAHINLGRALTQLGAVEDAEASLRKALDLSPGDARALVSLGTLMLDHNRISAARRALEEAMDAAPGFVPALANLAKLHQNIGDIPKAVEIGRRAVDANPALAEVHSNLLFALQYDTAQNEGSLAAEAAKWAEVHAARPAKPPMAAKTARPDATKRIRVGYVSADLRRHSVGHFMAAILASYDKDRFETFCYANGHLEDATSRWFGGLADAWRPIFGLSDSQAAVQIAEDGIDILVDLSGHTAGNRLAMFAHKAAPVQVTYLGYPGTTGLDAIDYRISDDYADPESAESSSAETIIRLPGGFHCYTPPEQAPEVGGPPASESGFVTFGSFNNIAKVSPDVIETWSRILAAVPGSRLVLKHRVFACRETREHFQERFTGRGIAAGRLDLRPGTADLAEHMAAYGDIDLALDTFPYNGTATTCEALWMGVPVVSLWGTRHAGRVGASLLHTLGTPEMLADNVAGYVDIAVDLAGNLDALAEKRAAMRNRMQASPLMDAPGFTRKLEAAYQAMWRKYCADACQ